MELSHADAQAQPLHKYSETNRHFLHLFIVRAQTTRSEEKHENLIIDLKH
jgi:hypothetical protein